MDDTSVTGTVCPWRSDTNIFKILGFHFWSKMAHFRSKIAIFGLFSYKDKNIPSYGVPVDDTTGTGTVFCCRSDENIFKNLRFHFWSKMAHFRTKIAIFGLFSLLKASGTIKKT